MLFSMPVLLYGGYMILLTAALLICSLLFFSVTRNSPLCTIRFGPASLQTVYGASFWLTLATGQWAAPLSELGFSSSPVLLCDLATQGKRQVGPKATSSPNTALGHRKLMVWGAST